MLKIQELFNDLGTEETLKKLEEMNINSKIYEHNDTKYIHLDYGINSDKFDEITKECRGLILKDNTYEIVRMGFYRFYNLGEPCCDQIDLSTPHEYEEKCDGSIIFLNYIKEIGWVTGTRGTMFGDICYNNPNTFHDIFWKYFPVKKEECDKFLDRENEYIFELCAPENRVVVLYQTPTINLIGMRFVGLWGEVGADVLNLTAGLLKVKRPKKFFFKNLEKAMAYLVDLKNFEGFVLKQWNDQARRYFRVKIKSEWYIDLHNVLLSKSINSFVKLIINNQRDLLVQAKFPQYLMLYDCMHNRMTCYFAEADNFWDSKKYILQQDIEEKEKSKLFALAVKDSEFSPYCFQKKKEPDMKVWDFYTEFGQIRKTALKNFILKLKLKELAPANWSIVEDESEVSLTRIYEKLLMEIDFNFYCKFLNVIDKGGVKWEQIRGLR